MNRAALAGLAVVALAAVGAGVALFSGVASEPPPPNVLVIVWDTVRADRMSLYGGPRQTTPKLDAWAESAVVFDQARSPAMWTMPSHASLFTGLAPYSHGVSTEWRWLDTRFVTLAEHLGGLGYDTFGFTANQYASANHNLFQGIDASFTVYEPPVLGLATRATKAKLIPEDASTEMSPGYKPPKGSPNLLFAKALQKDAADVGRRGFLKWLDELRPNAGTGHEKPFFAFMNVMEAHWPRVPSMEARQAVIGDRALIERGLHTDATLFTTMSYHYNRHEYSDGELEAMTAVYDASLWELDRATDALLTELAARELLDNTIVVITSDHGEHLGEHHLFDHRYGLYEPLVHVPLVIRYPKGLEPRRELKPVNTYGVFAAVLSLAGLPGPADGVRRPSVLEPSGRAFAEYPPGANQASDALMKAYPTLNVSKWMRQHEAVVEDGYKLIRSPDDGRHELYHITEDPEEAQNLVEAAADRVQSLSAAFAAWRQEQPEYDPAQRAEDDGPKHMDKALKEALLALGYAQESGEELGAGGKDSDLDGFIDQEDCAPEDGQRYPGARELPGNGRDDDCDGSVDEVGVE